MHPQLCRRQTWYVPDLGRSSRLAADAESSGDPTRKDIATTYTCKLILDTTPLPALELCFGNVTEVEVTSNCITGDFGILADVHPVNHCLSALAAKNSSTISLHVTFHASESGFELFMQLNCFSNSMAQPGAITYEFFGMPLKESHPMSAMSVACILQAIIHFDTASPAGPGEHATTVGRQLFDCVGGSRHGSSELRGRLYLCDIPALIMTTDEIAAADDVDEAAKLKLFDASPLAFPDALTVTLQVRPRWDDFDSVVHLVKTGFKPAIARAESVES